MDDDKRAAHIDEYGKTTPVAPEFAAKNRRLAIALGCFALSIYLGYIVYWGLR